MRVWLVPLFLVSVLFVAEQPWWPVALIAVIILVIAGGTISSVMNGTKPKRAVPGRFMSFAFGYGAARLLSQRGKGGRSDGGGGGG